MRSLYRRYRKRGPGAAAAMRRRLVAGLVALEVAGLGGALLLYRAMDRSQGAAGRPGGRAGCPRSRGLHRTTAALILHAFGFLVGDSTGYLMQERGLVPFHS